MSKESFEGATVDAALELAAEKLGVEKSDLEYQVVEEKKDFWGTGGDTVVIEASARAEEPEPVAEPEAPIEPEPTPEPEAVAAPEPAPEAEPASGTDDEPTSAAESDDTGVSDGASTSLSEREPADSRPQSAPAAGDEEVEPETIAKLLDQIFHDMEFACTVEIQSQPDGFLATVVGDDKEAVLEGNGRCLSALELIANNAFRHRLPAGNKVRVDAGDFRSRRDEELSDLAFQVAHSAKESGRTQETQPLNPYERRLVHLALAEDSAVTTKSRGSGFLKNVQVIPESRGNRGGGRGRGRRR